MLGVPRQILLGRWICVQVAVKVLRKATADPAAHEEFQWEAQLLHSLRHPYILNFFGTSCNGERVRCYHTHHLSHIQARVVPALAQEPKLCLT